MERPGRKLPPPEPFSLATQTRDDVWKARDERKAKRAAELEVCAIGFNNMSLTLEFITTYFEKMFVQKQGVMIMQLLLLLVIVITRDVRTASYAMRCSCGFKNRIKSRICIETAEHPWLLLSYI